MKFKSILSAVVLAAAVVGCVFAQDKKNEYISIDEVKVVADDWRDFQIQGEYVWKNGGMVFACQCIADGDGQFTVVGFPGGFPGEGWIAKEVRVVYKGQIEGNEVILKPAYMDMEGQNNLPIPEVHQADVTKIDLEGKLKLEYYKLQPTFEGEIKLQNLDGEYVPAKQKGAAGGQKKSTLDEILERINEKYKGKFTDADRVIIDALHQKLMKNQRLQNSAKTTDPKIFTESIFPSAFGDAAMESYTESEESYAAMFADKSKYDAIMGALAGVIYREMRKSLN